MTSNAKSSQCDSCRVNKATHSCGLCHAAICKSCTEFLDSEAFSFMKNVPSELKHQQYCSFCYSSTVQPAQEIYAETMRRARKIFIIDKPRRRPLPLLKSSKEILCIEKCADREETLLRLAFFAAEMGFNAVIKVNIAHKKIRNGGYQHTEWSGTGYPADLDGPRLEKQSEEESP
jgi:hypothetical protein